MIVVKAADLVPVSFRWCSSNKGYGSQQRRIAYESSQRPVRSSVLAKRSEINEDTDASHDSRPVANGARYQEMRAPDLHFKGEVPVGYSKIRLDAFVVSCMPHASRGKVQASLREGLVCVNGVPQTKASYAVKPKDKIECWLLPPEPLEAAPEDIPLDVVYEDSHLLVVNKAPHMVVHPSPGHSTGTLVNGLLHHCGLPAMSVLSGSQPSMALDAAREPQGLQEGSHQGDDGVRDEDEADDAFVAAILAPLHGPVPIIRPGIVHRLDKGTSGLLVVAKDEVSHRGLCEQFKARTVERAYVAVTCGVPNPSSGRVEAPIGRDPKDRKRMAVVHLHQRGTL